VLGSCHGYRRGLDVDHMTHVINYDLPDSVKLMSTESVVQVELIRKERRFLWFSRLSGVKLNAMCAKSGKFFLFQRERR